MRVRIAASRVQRVVRWVNAVFIVVPNVCSHPAVRLDLRFRLLRTLLWELLDCVGHQGSCTSNNWRWMRVPLIGVWDDTLMRADGPSI